MYPENILEFCDFLVRQARIPARAGLELKTRNVRIDRLLVPQPPRQWVGVYSYPRDLEIRKAADCRCE